MKKFLLGLSLMMLIGCTSRQLESSAAEAKQYQVGQPANFKIEDLKPTQSSVGYNQIYYKLGRYSYENEEGVSEWKLYEDYNEDNGFKKSSKVDIYNGDSDEIRAKDLKTVVIGPNNQPYITDGHHTLTTLTETAKLFPELKEDISSINLLVEGDFSDLSEEEFENEMIQREWVLLEDENGNEISFEELPLDIAKDEFGNNPYRALAYYTRDVVYNRDEANVIFFEFKWADYYRYHLEENGYEFSNINDFLDAYTKALDISINSRDDKYFEEVSYLYKDLGTLDHIDYKELTKALRKVAYSFYYQSQVSKNQVNEVLETYGDKRLSDKEKAENMINIMKNTSLAKAS